MSILSEKLKYFLSQKGYTMAELSGRSGIERSTLYQYLKGSRPLKNRRQLEMLMSELQLTPEERMEVLEAYEITQVGLVQYNRRCKVRKILNSLLIIEDKESVAPKLEQEMYLRTTEGQQLMEGELEINRLVNNVIYETMVQGGEIRLLTQPDNDLLMESLLLLCDDNVQTRVTQIICLEVNGGRDGCRNLENIRRILRYGIGIRRYEPRYYYGSPAEHYGIMNVMPYLVVTDRYAVQISSDWKAAILHSNTEVVAYFDHFFEKMRRQSHTLMISVDGFGGNQAKWGQEYVKNTTFSNTLEICSGLCSVQFWDKHLIGKYINRKIPDCASVIKNYTAYTAALYRAKKHGQVTVLMNASFVEAFIRDGILREYPSVFFNGAISISDRRILIERILKAVGEGWYHIRLLPAENFPLSYHWEILISRGENMLFQYAHQNQFKIFQFQEADILEAFYDYLENISAGEDVLGDVQSAEQLREWMEKYLK